MQAIFTVTGLGTGEETKGNTVEWLTNVLEAHTIIRSGGAQSGHHVTRENGVDVMFSHYGAGTFEGAKTHVKHEVISPFSLFEESQQLEKCGILNPEDLITIDNKCLVVTPFHGAYSRLLERFKGKDKKGTVGMGVGFAIKESKLSPDYVFYAWELTMGIDYLKAKMEKIRLRVLQKAIDLICEYGAEELNEDEFAEMKILIDPKFGASEAEFFYDFSRIFKIVDDQYFQEVLTKEGFIVSEASHGALHSPKHGFVPHVTQIDPTARDVLESVEDLNYQGTIFRLGVLRTYMTRHGAGPLVSYSESLSSNITETHNNVANDWLGGFRNGFFDPVAARYALKISAGQQGLDGLVISYMDKLEGLFEWEVCVGYKYNGLEQNILSNFFEINNGIITNIKLNPNLNSEEHYQYQSKLTELLKDCTPITKILKPTVELTLSEVFLLFVEFELDIPVVALSYGPKVADKVVRPGFEDLFKSNLTQETARKFKAKKVFKQADSNKVLVPPSFALFNPKKELLEKHPTVLEAVSFRKDLLKKFQNIFLVLNSQSTIEELIRSNKADMSQLNDLYKTLVEFLKQDPNNARILLYLPFELLPNLKDSIWQFIPAAKEFIEIYKDCWFRLLFEIEIRSDYTNGDLLNDGNDLKVAKVAHFLPELLKRNLIDINELTLMLENISEKIILQSLVEGIVVSGELGLLQEEDLSLIFSIDSCKLILRNIIANSKQPVEKTYENIESVLLEFDHEYNLLQSSYSVNLEARLKWELQSKTETLLDNYSNLVVSFISSENDAAMLFSNPTISGRFLTKVFFEYVKSIAYTDIDKAKAIFQKFVGIIYHNKPDTLTNNLITIGLNHLYRLKVLDDIDLDSQGVQIPEFASLSPVDLDHLVRKELKDLNSVVDTIKNTEYLNKYLYPCVLAFGSKVKGYALNDSDTDVAIFFRPNTPFSLRKSILEKLNEMCPELKKIDKILEFWVDVDTKGINFKHSKKDKLIMGFNQIHILFGSIWMGNDQEVQYLYNTMLDTYLNSKQQPREKYLRVLESDAIKCRLLQKGFRRFHPIKPKVKVNYQNLIDANSDYWDTEFRKVSTQMFLQKVFLPVDNTVAV